MAHNLGVRIRQKIEHRHQAGVWYTRGNKCDLPWAGVGGGGYPYMIPGGGNITYGPGGGAFGSPLGSAGGG